ncbi:hypothetical protein F5Y19DRAFT_482334 [Xylariaceae sp. FL1651]|nr:hypothetical protein F5Y19DRAFT_482334 [Xylariaceae sp. FL1651]
MDSLDEYLEMHISTKDKRLFSGFGISTCNDDGEESVIFEPDSDWTLIYLSVDGHVGEDGAREIMGKIDQRIDRDLKPEQKPRRVAYCLLDNSGMAYRAKSHRVRGKLHAAECQNYSVCDEDIDPTPPASPRGEVQQKRVVEIDLESVKA